MGNLSPPLFLHNLHHILGGKDRARQDLTLPLPIEKFNRILLEKMHFQKKTCRFNAKIPYVSVFI